MTSKRTKIIIGIFVVLASIFIVFRMICAYCIVFITAQAEEAMEEGDYEKAVDKLLLSQKFLFEGETSEKNSALLADCYYELEMYAEAIKNYQDALNENSSECGAVYYNNIGVSYANLGEYEKAIEYYSNALELKPDYAEVCSSIGALYIRLEQPDMSIQYFERAIELDPDFAITYGNCAYAYAQMGDFDKAYEYLQKSMEHDYDNAEALYNLIEEMEYYYE